MANVRNLFDFQKIAENKDMADIINSVEAKYGTALSDDELELATAGAGDANAQTVQHMCDKCKRITSFRLMSGGRAVCTEPGCGNMIVM